MHAFVKRHRRLVGFGLISVIVVGCFSLNFGVGVFQHDRLLTGRARWEASSIRDYRIVVDVTYAAYRIGNRYAITVRDGEIAEADSLSLLFVDGDYPYEPVSPEEAAEYTIEALFERAASALAARSFISRLAPIRSMKWILTLISAISIILRRIVEAGCSVVPSHIVAPLFE